ncbi:MAG: pyridoxamine 5'-phosphate oxidase family protein [Acidimicrobiales bacterium]
MATHPNPFTTTGADLSEAECWEVLRAAPVGRLAVSVLNKPDIFPVNFSIVEGEIYVNTAPGTKLAAAVSDEIVAFEVDRLDEFGRRGTSVVVRGPAVEVEALEELMALENVVEPWDSADKRRFLRITPTEITGRRIG